MDPTPHCPGCEHAVTVADQRLRQKTAAMRRQVRDHIQEGWTPADRDQALADTLYPPGPAHRTGCAQPEGPVEWLRNHSNQVTQGLRATLQAEWAAAVETKAFQAARERRLAYARDDTRIPHLALEPILITGALGAAGIILMFLGAIALYYAGHPSEAGTVVVFLTYAAGCWVVIIGGCVGGALCVNAWQRWRHPPAPGSATELSPL